MIWLTITGLCLNFIGAGLLAKPLLKSKELINEISTYEDSGAVLDMGVEKKTNNHLKKSLEQDNVFGIIGLTLLGIGFILQLIGELL